MHRQKPDMWEKGYEIVSILGSGGHAWVYANKSIGMMLTESYLTEWSFMTLLSHPHILKPDRVIVDQSIGTINFVMSKMECSLQDLKEAKGTIPEQDLKIIMWQILSVLDYLHTGHIVHRDLKASNIMMVSEDSLEIRVIDFGVAKVYSYDPSLLLRSSSCNLLLSIAKSELDEDSYCRDSTPGILTTVNNNYELLISIFRALDFCIFVA